MADTWGMAEALSVLLTASTMPLRASIFVSKADKSLERGGTISRVIVNLPSQESVQDVMPVHGLGQGEAVYRLTTIRVGGFP